MDNKKISPFSLTTEQYLAQYQIGTYFEDAVGQLLEYKDENSKVDPAKFFHEYFTEVLEGNHTLFREFDFVQATPRNRASFVKNFWRCFQHIGRNGDLLNIKEYHSLVCLLCPDFPFEVLQKTAKIILMDDAMDCLMSFSDFLYAFQVQFYYEDFLAKCDDVYRRVSREPQINTDDAFYGIDLNVNDGIAEGVKSKHFMDALHADIYTITSLNSFSFPPENALHEILDSVTRVSFYGFLMALTKNDTINASVGVLPDKTSLMDVGDQDVPRSASRPLSARSRPLSATKK